MAKFGGLGGCGGGREMDASDLFEAAVARCMGERLRKESAPENASRKGWYDGKTLGHRLYGSITNQDWRHDNGDTAGYSFRAAGDLIAAVIGDGDYMDWYCSSAEGVVDAEVAELLAKEGWRPFGGEIAEALR